MTMTFLRPSTPSISARSWGTIVVSTSDEIPVPRVRKRASISSKKTTTGTSSFAFSLAFWKIKEKANEDVPVVVFFDEMDALFRTRGTGISSDVETTIVPQLLAEIDGVEGLKNVIVIGASNRQDRIDPAILRPGRLDVKIKIERPDQAAASDIFHKYLTTDIPIQEPIDAMIGAALEAMYSLSEENRFLEVTYANGDKEVLYFKDFSSGAMIESVVRRAKKLALKR